MCIDFWVNKCSLVEKLSTTSVLIDQLASVIFSGGVGSGFVRDRYALKLERAAKGLSPSISLIASKSSVSFCNTVSASLN